MTVRILIVDDHGLIRAGLRSLLNDKPEYSVVGEANDGETAIKRAAELLPDIVLMDVSLPGISGMEATRRVLEVSPKSRVLALTAHEDDTMLREMIRAGAYGYLIKRAVESDLINALQVVSQGYMYVFPAMTRALFDDISPLERGERPTQVTLTNREIEILKLLARGHTNRQIAQIMNISPRTVEGYRSNLVSKLGVSSRVDFLNYAESHGLLEKK